MIPLNLVNTYGLTILLTIIMFMGRVDTRQFEQSFNFKQVKEQRSWFYLDKIALGEGSTEIKVATKKVEGQSFGTSGQIYIDLITESDWQAETKGKCSRPMKSPIIIHRLQLDGKISVSQMNMNVSKSQMYYFVLKDCNKRFINDYSNQKMWISLTITTINNGSHFGEQQDDHWMIIPFILVAGMWLLFSNKDFLKESHLGQPDYIKMILFAGIATNISSLFWKSIGYILYATFGVNYLIFHLIYLFMHALSETIVICLLILISFGWSINHQNSQNFQLIAPAFCMIASINIVTALLTQIQNNSHDMHHTFDAAAGLVFLLEKLVLSFVFLVGIIKTYRQSRHLVKKFMIYFGVLGFLYICSNPIIVYIANEFLPRKDRNQFVFVGVQILKTTCNILLRYMVGSKQSQYNRLNYKNSSFLPDNAMF